MQDDGHIYAFSVERILIGPVLIKNCHLPTVGETFIWKWNIKLNSRPNNENPKGRLHKNPNPNPNTNLITLNPEYSRVSYVSLLDVVHLNFWPLDGCRLLQRIHYIIPPDIILPDKTFPRTNPPGEFPLKSCRTKSPGHNTP